VFIKATGAEELESAADAPSEPWTADLVPARVEQVRMAYFAINCKP
jgi:hypothetical protein